MRAKEIREMTSEDLVVKCKELKEELFNLKFQLSLGQLTNTAKIKKSEEYVTYKIIPK